MAGARVISETSLLVCCPVWARAGSARACLDPLASSAWCCHAEDMLAQSSGGVCLRDREGVSYLWGPGLGGHMAALRSTVLVRSELLRPILSVREFAVIFKATMGGHSSKEAAGARNGGCLPRWFQGSEYPEDGLQRCGLPWGVSSEACRLPAPQRKVEQDLLKCRPKLWGHRWDSAGVSYWTVPELDCGLKAFRGLHQLPSSLSKDPRHLLACASACAAPSVQVPPCSPPTFFISLDSSKPAPPLRHPSRPRSVFQAGTGQTQGAQRSRWLWKRKRCRGEGAVGAEPRGSRWAWRVRIWVQVSALPHPSSEAFGQGARAFKSFSVT